MVVWLYLDQAAPCVASQFLSFFLFCVFGCDTAYITIYQSAGHSFSSCSCYGEKKSVRRVYLNTTEVPDSAVQSNRCCPKETSLIESTSTKTTLRLYFGL